MFDGIIQTISDTIRSILFGPLGAILGWIIDIVDIILTEISGFSFIDLSFVTSCYSTCMTIALVILPLKLVYEWIWLVISNDIEKWGHKIFAVFQIVVILLATPPLLTTIGDGVTQINKAILAGDVISGESSASGEDAGEGFAVTMLVATTGMEEEEAQTFIDDFTGEDFDINVRDDEENYIYEFDFIMPMFVGLVMWIIIFFIGLQMASRQVSLAFFKIITPLCALSLTNKENSSAFTVWKNNIIGPFLMNTVQIFLFLFMFKLIAELGTEASGLAKLLFTIALLLVIIAIPNKVAAMIGGYNAGIMEGLSSLQSSLIMTSSAISTAKVVAGGAGAIGNMAKSGVSMLTHAPNNIARMSGTAVSHAGGMKDSINRSASHVKEAMKYGGGIGGAATILGSEAYHAVKDKVSRGTGGLGSQFRQSKKEADLKAAFSKDSPLTSKDVSSRERTIHSSGQKMKDTDYSSESKEGMSERMTGQTGSFSRDGKESRSSENGFGKINTTGRLNKSRNSKERRFK